MKKEYLLTSPEVTSNDFKYVFSHICKKYPQFRFENGAAVNAYDSEINYYEYISLISKEKYGVGTTAKTVCSFDKYGAPLIVLTDDLSTDEEGRERYGLHFEVVVYEDGINVWHIVPWPERKERPIKPTLIAQSKFKIDDGSKINLSVTVKEKKLLIDVNGFGLTAEHPDIPESFHIGITACEGINRFYSFTLEN